MLEIEIEETSSAIEESPVKKSGKVKVAPVEQPSQNTTPTTQKTVTPRAKPVEKEKFNALMEKDLLERAKNIAFFTPNLSLTDMVSEGLLWVVEQYEAENNGRYAVRTGKLKTGRKPRSPSVIASSSTETTVNNAASVVNETPPEVEVDVTQAPEISVGDLSE